MPNRQTTRGLIVTIQAALLVLVPGFMNFAVAEIQTLFTTPQERRIINANRYKVDEIDRRDDDEEIETAFIAPGIQQEVSKIFVISGITISESGPHSVWINNQHYEDGEHLDDNSHIKVLSGSNIRVRITTPDGKRFYATSGETLEINYLGSIEN